MLEHAAGMSAGIERRSQALATVQKLSRRIQFAFLKVAETVAVFRTLCTLTRIETSRLGDDGSEFGDLAGEVKPLSERIHSTGQGILDAAVRLDENIQTALQKEADLSAKELRELDSLIAGVTGSLHAFEERLGRALQASEFQTAQHQAVCGAMQDLVGSIQFHDITHQQIEHVCQALLEARPGAARAGQEVGPPDSGARAVLSLQVLQLASTEAAFARSFSRMERDLDGIAARVREMAQVSQGLMGTSGSEQDAFFLRMEGSMTGILRTFGACDGAEAAIRATAGGLEKTVAGMRYAIAEIRGIEIQIQRIAVNATIRSVHIGAPGDALNVIAGAMHQKVLESSQNTEQVAQTLDSMNEAVHQVSEVCGAPGSEGKPEDNGALDQMRESILELHSMSERSFSRIHQIAALSSQLGEDIQSLRSGLTAGPLFAEVVTGARTGLERPRRRWPAPATRPTPFPRSENLAKRYHPQSERQVHQAAASGERTGAAEAADSNSVGEGNIFGDNVELF